MIINKIKNHLFIMKKIKYLILFPYLVIGSIVSCTPDYVTDATPAIENPSNPSGQSITLNFTSGEFVGVLNNANFVNAAGVATRFILDDNPSYLLVYGNGTNQLNANIINKENGQLTNITSNESDSNNTLAIRRSEKLYTSTTGTFTITDEQIISNQNNMEIIRCKFTFDGTFEVKDISTSEIIETGVKINGTIVF